VFFQILKHIEILLALDFASCIALSKYIFSARSAPSIVLVRRAIRLLVGAEVTDNRRSGFRKLSFNCLAGRRSDHRLDGPESSANQGNEQNSSNKWIERGAQSEGWARRNACCENERGNHSKPDGNVLDSHRFAPLTSLLLRRWIGERNGRTALLIRDDLGVDQSFTCGTSALAARDPHASTDGYSTNHFIGILWRKIDHCSTRQD
jgi:hypothetical protein